MRARKHHGFSLVEMAMVLLIIGVVMAIAMPITGSVMDASNRTKTSATLQGIQTALTNFVAQNRRLPCPADGSIASGAANAGVEARVAATGVCLLTPGAGAAGETRGVVPWVTLGISEAEARDAWNNRITYRVPPGPAGMTQTDALNMSDCDAGSTFVAGPVTACNGGCTSATLGTICTRPTDFLTNRGLQLYDGSANCLLDPFAAVPTGAAYVLISHGANRAGGYMSSGALVPAAGASPPQSPLEAVNNNGVVLKVPAVSCTGGAGGLYYVNAPFGEGAGVSHFDDIVVAQSIMNLVTAAGVGPRVHP